MEGFFLFYFIFLFVLSETLPTACIHTHTQAPSGKDCRVVSLLRRLSEPGSHQHGNHNTTYLLTASVVPCDWGHKGEAEEGGWRGKACVYFPENRDIKKLAKLSIIDWKKK